MFLNSSFMQNMDILRKGIDTANLRQQTISNNIANVNTPYYKRKEVTFEGELHRALYGPTPISSIKTDSRHIKFKGEISLSQVKPKINMERDTFSTNNKNNVDINEEMASLAKNSMMSDALMTSEISMGKRLMNVLTKGAKV